MEWSRSDTSDDLSKINVPSRHWEFERRSQRRPHVASRCRELVVRERVTVSRPPPPLPHTLISVYGVTTDYGL